MKSLRTAAEKAHLPEPLPSVRDLAKKFHLSEPISLLRLLGKLAPEMVTLRLTQIKCHEETDEVGWDSPYFVVFVGRGHGSGKLSSDLKFLKKWNWDNEFESGTKQTFEMSVATGVEGNSLVLIAMLEEDDNPDFETSQERFKKL